VSREERVSAVIVKFAAVVTLEPLDRNTKLCMNIDEKIRQGRESVRLESQGKCP
jgi:hypothetical protein